MRRSKIVYSYDNNGLFIGTDIAHESWDTINSTNPIYLFPCNSTEIEPPSFDEKKENLFFNKESNIWYTKIISIQKDEEQPTWENIRLKRDYMLIQSDWSALSDSNPKPSREIWLEYRQKLRDIPQQFSSPEDVVFPARP